MKYKFEWELMEDNSIDRVEFQQSTFRAKTFGGWIVRHETQHDFDEIDHSSGYRAANNTMVFVPDPDHEWEVEEEND